MKKQLLIVASMLLGGSAMAAKPATPEAVLAHYAELAQAMYSDSLTTAKTLQLKVNELVEKPSDITLTAARDAWVAARHPYQQTEAYRFGNPIVDDWEGKVNAWPLDEGLIDYVDGGYGSESDENPFYSSNIIANKQLKVGGEAVDASSLTKTLLSEQLHEIGEVESNVATGYHAIEFLLWGQDLNGTDKGAGARPATDFNTAACTGGNCDRRAAYLKAASDLLIDDLNWMVEQWADKGEARVAITEGDLQKNLATIFTGMGSLSYGELAGERMKLGLLLHDPEEEHDCFSDNTHWSHYNDVLGIKNVYTGTYKRTDGTMVKGPSLSDLVATKDGGVDKSMRDHLDATLDKMQVLVTSAEAGESYDQLIAEGNDAGNAKVKAAVDALVAQTRAIEQAVSAMGLEQIAFEGSDSLDSPDKVQ